MGKSVFLEHMLSVESCESFLTSRRAYSFLFELETRTMRRNKRRRFFHLAQAVKSSFTEPWGMMNKRNPVCIYSSKYQAIVLFKSIIFDFGRRNL